MCLFETNELGYILNTDVVCIHQDIIYLFSFLYLFYYDIIYNINYAYL